MLFCSLICSIYFRLGQNFCDIWPTSVQISPNFVSWTNILVYTAMSMSHSVENHYSLIGRKFSQVYAHILSGHNFCDIFLPGRLYLSFESRCLFGSTWSLVFLKEWTKSHLKMYKSMSGSYSNDLFNEFKDKSAIFWQAIWTKTHFSILPVIW